jgi:zinc transporter, ZIP family
LASAVALTIGMAIQNIPEGMAVPVILKREGVPSKRCFKLGVLSGIVEPVFAAAGAAVVTVSQSILPYALAFAAGAMIFIVVEEVLPESQLSENNDLATLFFIIGFALMMVLDVAFS